MFWLFSGGNKKTDLEVSDEAAQLVQGVGLHEDVVLGEQEGGYLRQLAYRRGVCVGDDAAQLVQCIVQVVHPSPLTCVYVQAYRLALTVLPLAAKSRTARTS